MARNKRALTIVIALAALVAVSVGVFLMLYDPEPEGLKVGVSVLPDSLNPVLPQNVAGLNANELLFDGLVNYEIDPETGSRVALFALADSIVQDPATKRVFEVTLRDAAWHDGRELEADDVVFSFAAYVNPANGSPMRTFLDSFIEKVEALDERRVAVTFRKPIPEFRAYPILTFKIIPRMYRGEALSTDLRSGALEREFSVAPVGTGPFAMDAWEIGEWLSFKANHSYHRGTPASERLILQNIIDPVIRLNEFVEKRINLILETSPLERQALASIRGVSVSSFMPYAFYHVAINARRDPLRSPAARAALASAVDPARAVPGISDDATLAVVNRGPFPSGLFDAEYPDYRLAPLSGYAPYDAKAAAAAIGSQGLAGKTLSLAFPDSMGAFGQALADGAAAQLREAGLAIEVKRLGDQVFKRLVELEGDYDLALRYCDCYDNLYSGLADYYGSTGNKNIYGLSDPRIDALLDRWNAASEAQAWIRLTRELNDALLAASPAIPLLSVKKDVYARGIYNITIASDNPFLSVEEWSQEKD